MNIVYSLHDDISTDEVRAWLHYFDTLNEEYQLCQGFIEIKEICIKLGTQGVTDVQIRTTAGKLDFTKLGYVWFMKYSILICIFYLSHINPALAQSHGALQYYNLCNKAELAICDSNIDIAYQFYKQAFIINAEKPFSQDLLNAFHCAIDLGYYADARQYLKRILYRGVKQKHLHRQIYQYYTGYILDSIKCFVAQCTNDTNKLNAYALKMKELVGKDQGIRQYYIKKGIVQNMGDSVVKLDKEVSNELYQYFLSNGLRNADTNGHFGGEINNDVHYQVIVIHQKQAALRGTVNQLPYDSILYSGIFTYDYPPKYFLCQYQVGNKSDFLKEHPELALLTGLEGAYFNDTLFSEKIDQDKITSMNAAYALLGLPEYDETSKRVAFRNRCELTGGSFSKYKVENTVCSIMYCETEAGIKNWKSEFQNESR